MAQSLVGRFEHLPNRPRSDEARPLLEKIASQVKPIMSKRGWKVGTLAEFLPSNPALLGNSMNAGERINLRLRPPGETSTFYEYDQLVLVMLHELTHIEHGPHDAMFYKLLAELEEEFYDLKRKGYSGEGFHGAGNHLSGFKVPHYVGKTRGLDAAQKRLDTQRKMGKGGVLGGSDVRGKGMKEVLAEAAERRIRDDKACHPQDAGHTKEVDEEIKKAQEESVGVDAADLESSGHGHERVSGDSTSQTVLPVQRSRDPIQVQARPPIHPDPPTRANVPLAKQPKAQHSVIPRPPQLTKTIQNSPSTTLPSGEWSCPTCTLLNTPSSLTCDACASPRPRQGNVWYCEFCAAGPRDMGFWSCAECGWVRKWG